MSWQKVITQSKGDVYDVRLAKRDGLWYLALTIPGPEGTDYREVRVGQVLTAAEKQSLVSAVKKCVDALMADAGRTEV